MAFSKKRRVLTEVFIGLAIFFALVLGIAIGLNFALQRNLDVRRDFEQYEPALPTQILDRSGNLITELFSDEKRDIIPVNELPKELIYALLSREDKNFYSHNGVDYFNFFRAVVNNIRQKITGHGSISGFSTLTMQVAGLRYVDRTDRSIWRKLREIWYAYQIEKALTKNEILELYVNHVYFGHNTHGVEAASMFYFGHSARELTVAESAILVVQLANPALFSMINHPESARLRQIAVLEQMVSLGYITQATADESYTDFWDDYNTNIITRSNIASAYFDNSSRAPYFSEYVRLQLNDMLFGAVDVNRDGYVVHTTLDLRYQEIAEEQMMQGYTDINRQYRERSSQRLQSVDSDYIPIIELLGLTFNLEDIRTAGSKEKQAAQDIYLNDLNPSLYALSLMLGIQDLRTITGHGLRIADTQAKKTVVEGALITLENNTGHILAMVGGSDFETKKYNRAIDAQVQPGSSIKPLFYSAAISSRNFTAATRLYDGPVVFTVQETGEVSTPNNFLGTWDGWVLLRKALATSLNIPSTEVLLGTGYEPAIDRMTRMLGMEDKKDNRTLFPHTHALALGVTTLAPVNMARAFAVFPSQGREVEPIAIISVEDRQGNIILEPEKDRLKRMQQKGRNDQIMTPQEAYVMVDLLQSTVNDYGGTLNNRRIEVGGYDGMPIAGKTGTTDNWQAAWTVGFSPYMTTAIWYGFDTPGLSLGAGYTGSTVAGPVWSRYMKEVHKNLERIPFNRPETGLINTRICTVSGLLPTNICGNTREELFLTGTEPRRTCDVHPYEAARADEIKNRMRELLMLEDLSAPPDMNTRGSFLDPLTNMNSGSYRPQALPDSGDYNPLLD